VSESNGGEKQLLIGWASTSITPDKPVQLHGQFHERVSRYVRDPVTATALALETVGEDGAGEQAIMLSCDLVNLTRAVAEKVREIVRDQLADFDAGKLFINATHTHTGPTIVEDLYPPARPGVMRPAEYAEFFVDRATKVIVEAWNARKPGGVSRALGHAAVGFNRRVVYEDGTARMYGSSDTPAFMGVEGDQDHGMELLFFYDEVDRLTGVVVNVACPSQVVENKHFVSADFWDEARKELRRRFHPDLFVYPMTGAAGDQSPRDLVRRGRGEPNFRDEDGLVEMGRRIAKGVEYAFRTAQSPVAHQVVMSHHVEELSLPMRKATRAEAEEACADMDKLLAQNPNPDPYSGDARWVRRYREAIERYETQGDDPRYSFDLHVIRLGDVAIATNPFELYLDYGYRIKARSKAEQTLIAQLTGDRGIYLPTAKAVRGGHYGAMIYDNIVGPEGGQVLVDCTVELVNGMWAAPPKNG